VTELEVAGDLYLLVAALGLALAVDYAGLPMLGQSAFVAVGGFGTFQLAAHGTPLVAAALVSVIIAAVAGALLAVGAGWLSAARFALASWALAWLAQAILDGFPSVSGGSQGLVRASPSRLVAPNLGATLTLTTTVHLVVGLVLVVGTLAVLWRLGRSRLGGELAAIRSGSLLAESLGVDVEARRAGVLAAAAGLAAVGGAGGAVLAGSVAPSDVSPLLGLQLLVAVLIGAGWRPWGTVGGFAVVAALPHLSDSIASAAGVPEERVRGAITAGLLVAAVVARLVLDRRRVPAVTSYADAPPLSPQPATWRPDAAMGDAVVVARDLRLSFGAVDALDGVDLELRAGEVHAVIGPNGSGKTTLLRVLGGSYRPRAGTVTIGGEPAPRATAARVVAGVVRTPQQSVLPRGLAPLRQVEVGAAVAERQPGGGLRALVATPASRRLAVRQRQRAVRALSLVGLAARSGADRLDAGEQRLVQVARAVATGARALLLDEPAAGATEAERTRLVETIRALAGSGAAVCVVDHDMHFVAAVADRVTVLDAGRVIASGTPAEVRRDPAVRQVYLGEGAA
jgi:branched-chain amino acid transport system permease protein